MSRNLYRHFLAGFALAVTISVARAETVSIVITSNAAPRVVFGAAKLAEALKAVKVDAGIVTSEKNPGRKIYLNRPHDSELGPEGFQFGFTFGTKNNNDEEILSGDDSGALYGCLELAKRIHESGNLPFIKVQDKPVMKLRGTCVAMQKTFILPGRHVYEYPYTPDLFPWFYDKKLWTEYLDFLAANRMNTLYFWSGHPFASLVRLKDYPYAVEVPDDVFQKNQEQFRWLAQECDKRGIWLVQMFYNIIVSKPFAETNGISTQLSAPTPLTEDYTRKSIAEFVKQYPNVGLMVCLGEALRDTPNQLEWCTNVILPGVLDGMRAANLKAEPPVVIRTHAMDADAIMPAAYQVYSNLFTEIEIQRRIADDVGAARQGSGHATGDGQARTASREHPHPLEPRTVPLWRHGVHQKICAGLARPARRDVAFICIRCRIGTGRIRQTSPIRRCCNGGATGFGLKRGRVIRGIPTCRKNEDHAYWISRLADFYGNTNAAEKILDAYNFAGEVAPRLIRRFGITEGNRQTLSLGMTLDQLVNPKKYGAIEDLWLSQAPPGERLDEFVKKEWNHEPHVGETPDSIIAEVLDYSSNAVAAADSAETLVTKNRDEFERLRNDARCIQAMAENYSAKVKAAELVLRYNYSHDLADMQRASKYLAESFTNYEMLVCVDGKNLSATPIRCRLRSGKFRSAEAFKGRGTNYLWSQLVPLYQKELADFQAKVAQLKQSTNAVAMVDESNVKPWPAASFKLISTNAEIYKVETGAKVFTDRDFVIQSRRDGIARADGNPLFAQRGQAGDTSRLKSKRRSRCRCWSVISRAIKKPGCKCRSWNSPRRPTSAAAWTR